MELLKADLKRVLKDKLFYVLLILAIVFALITPILYSFLFSSEDMLDDPLIAGMISAKSQFFLSFQLGNNLGLIAPVLLSIILCKDFSFGTIRNKIIAGKSRAEIFISLFLTCSIVFVLVMFLHAFVTLGVSLMFFDYQATPFTGSDAIYFLESVFFEILVLLFVSSLISWLCAAMKNVGLVIVLYVAISFVLVIIASVIQVVLSVFSMNGGNETIVSVLEFINRINIGNFVSYIGVGDSYSLNDCLYLTITPLVCILGLCSFGILKFNKKDFK